ncbi:hypothetical protein [Brunnivagina elsteri]|uniref:NADH:flavin oxidoreductase/NADH oxidase N-terminal domain-containing protein n=1 Tax=Brunnivagina elsteri CCALA 953 TaxID=987040 RepID=A0A2A2TCB6_9CYAN|nr:hypothetical protein [Calothrix elsteri]PAX51341.1 hypothetical protein CK510_25325 [Calothrix elsteri CCALA 953]
MASTSIGKIRNKTDTGCASVGFITNAIQADEIIRNQRADIVLLAREMLRDRTSKDRLSRCQGTALEECRNATSTIC